MITKAKVKQLGEKYDRITKSGKHSHLVRRILQDGRYIDEKGFLLGETEVKRIKEENKEMWKMGGMVVNVIDFYSEPKKV